MREYNILFVGVRCPLAVLEQRERDRGDREIGLARYQFDRVHRHGIYDLELNTSVLSVAECVAKIQAAVDSKREASAFERLGALRVG